MSERSDGIDIFVLQEVLYIVEEVVVVIEDGHIDQRSWNGVHYVCDAPARRLLFSPKFALSGGLV